MAVILTNRKPEDVVYQYMGGILQPLTVIQGNAEQIPLTGQIWPRY